MHSELQCPSQLPKHALDLHTPSRDARLLRCPYPADSLADITQAGQAPDDSFVSQESVNSVATLFELRIQERIETQGYTDLTKQLASLDATGSGLHDPVELAVAHAQRKCPPNRSIVHDTDFRVSVSAAHWVSVITSNMSRALQTARKACRLQEYKAILTAFLNSSARSF